MSKLYLISTYVLVLMYSHPGITELGQTKLQESINNAIIGCNPKTIVYQYNACIKIKLVGCLSCNTNCQINNFYLSKNIIHVFLNFIRIFVSFHFVSLLCFCIS